MRYEVTFRKSFNSEGNPVDVPRSYLRVPDTVIEEATLVRTNLPNSLLHPEEKMEEDDEFENVGTEVWEFEITSGHEEEFEEALDDCEAVIDYAEIEE